MVKAFHQAGIGVVLDVVYNHTCEGDHRGPIYSYKGIDAAGYYMLSSDPTHPYANYSGTGNTLNFGQRHVRKMVMDSLRYWKREMHVDGFRFDLASVFSRNADGSLNWGDAPIFSEIAADPELGRLRLIAEPWDTGAYQLGRGFPGITWLQWNGRFRDDIRRFVKSDAGMVPDVMRRIYGSDDFFPDNRAEAYHAYQSVNYVTSHDGFTLYDLVSYNQKRNWANGQQNQDGMDSNYSWNCGHEGDEAVPSEVLALRRKQVKNFCCLLFLSNGTPMFRAGDEFLNTQFGNNNPYNQDNETGWLDWNQLRANEDIYRFFKNMIAFRKSHPTLSRSRFWREDVAWYGVGPAADLSNDSRSLAFCLHGVSQGDDDIYVMINAYWEDLEFQVQEGAAQDWKRIVDTARQVPMISREAGVPLERAKYLVSSRDRLLSCSGPMRRGLDRSLWSRLGNAEPPTVTKGSGCCKRARSRSTDFFGNLGQRVLFQLAGVAIEFADAFGQFLRRHRVFVVHPAESLLIQVQLIFLARLRFCRIQLRDPRRPRSAPTCQEVPD